MEHGSVYGRLRAELVAQKFRPGEHLMIGQLADRYKVSPTPVREALSALWKEALVTFVPGKGCFCKLPDLRELTDLYNGFGIILGAAVEKGIDRVASGQVERTPDALSIKEDLSYSLGAEAANAKADLIEGALRVVVELAENQVLNGVAENFLARTHGVRLVDLEAPENFQLSLGATRRLLQAISAGNRRMARQIIDEETKRKTGALPVLVRETIARGYLAESRKLSSERGSEA